MRRFKVSGMSCETCVKAVTKAIWSTDVGALVDVDLGKGEVSVESRVGSPNIATAIRNAGFTVERVIS